MGGWLHGEMIYLPEGCQSHSGLDGEHKHWSGYSKPRLHTKFAERAFSFSDLPNGTACLPNDLRMITDTNVFKRKLKAYFYKLEFGMYPQSMPTEWTHARTLRPWQSVRLDL